MWQFQIHKIQNHFCQDVKTHASMLMVESSVASWGSAGTSTRRQEGLELTSDHKFHPKTKIE